MCDPDEEHGAAKDMIALFREGGGVVRRRAYLLARSVGSWRYAERRDAGDKQLAFWCARRVEELCHCYAGRPNAAPRPLLSETAVIRSEKILVVVL